MPRVQCSSQEGCGYTWVFTQRVDSTQLKRTYTVRCPRCGAKVFVRRKRQRAEARA